MRWLDADGTEREAEWQEPADPKQPSEDVCATDQEEKYVWAVPTQEGFALQLNSLLSVLTLARRLKRTAVLMPLLFTGPHYRRDVAMRRLPPTQRIDAYINISATLAHAPVRFAHFDDVYHKMPRTAKCVSCAMTPPPHVRCARGWDYAWCDREKVLRTRRPRCAAYYGEVRWPRECALCIYSAGFTPGVQLKDGDAWKLLRASVVLADIYEAGALSVAADLVGSSYVALHLRRGDKKHTMEKYGLTVPAVLDRVSLIARGRSVIVATDDRSPATLHEVSKRGFRLADRVHLERHAIPSDALSAYLVDLLICANADVWVGTMTGDNKSKQTALIRSLRKGRGKDIGKDHVLTRLP